MYQAPEQLVALHQANIEAASRFAQAALQSAERLFDFQIAATKTALADGASNVKAIASIKDIQGLAALKVQPDLDRASGYARGFYDVAVTTQTELNKLVEEQIAQFNKSFVTALDQAAKSAPAGSELTIATIKSAIAAVNAAYDNASKTAKQFADLAEANIAATAQVGTKRKAS